MVDSLHQIWSEVLKVPIFSNCDDFYAIGGNSLLAIQLYYKIKKSLNTDISFNYLLVRPLTIEGLAHAIVFPHVGKDAVDSHQQVKYDIEAFRKMNINFQKAGRANVVFLTGATGFIGSHILSELLCIQSISSIYCLVRANNSFDGFDRVVNALNQFNLKSNHLGKIKIVIGNLSEEKFGLGHNDWVNMSKVVDTIVSCGALVNFELSYLSLRNVNTLSTQTLMELASLGTKKSFHFVSSLAVFGIDHSVICDLKKFDESLNNKLVPASGYAQSKFASEKMIGFAIDKGLSANIYRLGEVMPSSVFGIPNPRSLYHLFIKDIIRLGFFPRVRNYYDYLPIDFVAKFVVRLIIGKIDHNKNIFNICHPIGLAFGILTDLLCDRFLLVGPIESKKLFCLMNDNPSVNTGIGAVINFYFNKNFVRYSNGEFDMFELFFLKEMNQIIQSNTSSKLLELGMVYPTLDQHTIIPYVDYLVADT